MLNCNEKSTTYLPGQVPRRDRQTLPLLYRLGLKRTAPPPVVRRCMSGGLCGYSIGMKQSNSKRPPAYGVPSGPAIMIFLKTCIWSARARRTRPPERTPTTTATENKTATNAHHIDPDLVHADPHPRREARRHYCVLLDEVQPVLRVPARARGLLELARVVVRGEHEPAARVRRGLPELRVLEREPLALARVRALEVDGGVARLAFVGACATGAVAGALALVLAFVLAGWRASAGGVRRGVALVWVLRTLAGSLPMTAMARSMLERAAMISEQRDVAFTVVSAASWSSAWSTDSIPAAPARNASH